MGGARTVVILAALLLIGGFECHAATAESQRTLRGKRLGLTEQVLAGGRRALLNTGSRDRFIQQSYNEAVEALIKERSGKERILGRRMLQIIDPIQTCGLAQLLVQAQVAGVPPQAIASVFLQFQIYDTAGTPSGFGLLPIAGGGSPQEQLCFNVRIQLQLLILQYQQRQGAAG